MTRGGFASRSMMPTVSTWPSCPPPMLLTIASLPSGVIWTLSGFEAGGHVVILAVYLGVADLLAVDVEQSHPVGAALDDERALAVGGDRDGDGQCWGRRRHRRRRLGSHRHRADRFHVLAIDRQHANRVVGAVGDQCQCSG